MDSWCPVNQENLPDLCVGGLYFFGFSGHQLDCTNVNDLFCMNFMDVAVWVKPDTLCLLVKTRVEVRCSHVTLLLSDGRLLTVEVYSTRLSGSMMCKMLEAP